MLKWYFYKSGNSRQVESGPFGMCKEAIDC